MDQAAAERKWAALHEDLPWHSGNFDDWAKDRSDSHPFHFSDGVQIWVDKTDWNPDDQFLTSGRYEPQEGPEGHEGD